MTQELITASDLYWITRLDNFKSMFGVILFVSAAVTIVALVAADSDDKLNKLALTLGLLGLLLGGCGLVFVPSTKEAIAIKVIPMIANNEDLQGIGSDLLDLTREWIQELRPEKKEKQ